jgi:hypothetical protein
VIPTGMTDPWGEDARVCYPPDISEVEPGWCTVFLAGSYGKRRTTWQDEFVAAVADLKVVVLDPQRTEWDGQPPSEEAMAEQVAWEQYWALYADVVVVHNNFNGLSPGRMVLLGQCAETRPEKVVVCIPEGWSWEAHLCAFLHEKKIFFCRALSDVVREVRSRVEQHVLCGAQGLEGHAP